MLNTDRQVDAFFLGDSSSLAERKREPFLTKNNEFVVMQRYAV